MSALCFQLKDGTAFREKASQKRIMGWAPTHVWEPQLSHGCSAFSPDHHQRLTCMLRQNVQSQDSRHRAFNILSAFIIFGTVSISVVSTKKFSSFEKGSTLSSNNSVSPTVLLKGSMSRSKHDCCVQKWGHFLACFQKSGHTTSHTHMSPQFFYTVYPASSCSG